MAHVARIFGRGEMNVLVHHVGGKYQIIGCTALPEDGTVVPNTGYDAVPARQTEALEPSLYGVDNLRFGQANIVGLCGGPGFSFR